MSRPRKEGTTLSPRDREILKDIIATFIVTGEPVSSRSLARHEQHGVSSATIRNVMADLEDLGYLTQPHTSAGRVPTEDGYHLYIDSLMTSRRLPVRDRRFIERSLADSVGAPDGLLTAASHLLSQLSHQIAVVLTPAIGDTVLKSIHFLPLSGAKVLCVVVSESGFIDNKVLETPKPLPREELLRISNYLNDNFGDMTIREIRDRLLRMMSEERARVDELLAGAIELAQQALRVDGDRELVVEGTPWVLEKPELADLERVRRLLDMFAGKADLVRLLNQLISGKGVRVVIGTDSEITSDLDFSLVATTYGVGGRALGSLGVFGPSRMEYQKMIPLVDYFGERLSRALELAYAD